MRRDRAHAGQADPVGADPLPGVDAGGGRELVVEAATTEGDPVVRYYRTGPGVDGVDVFEDATRDRFGGGWHHALCRSGRIDQTGACA